MLIKRLYLRNFRVYEDELDLQLPPGLVGIYGSNGSGKSTLLEAILFTLWGKARTTKEQVRSSGTGGDCVTEVEFEHEGHLYLVRRTLKGVNSNVTVEALCDGALMSTGVRDAQQYVESVLGMDDAAFRASVFTEQKQLAAFSNHAPADRRRLVMQLLGITPLDSARDAARRDARSLTSDHDRLRGMLPDLAQLETEAADAQAGADAAGAKAGSEGQAAEAAEARLAAARQHFDTVDARRQEYDALVLEGRAVREHLDNAKRSAEVRRGELAQLATLEDQLGAAALDAAGGDEAEAHLGLLAAVVRARAALDSLVVGPEPDSPDPLPAAAASERLAADRESLAADRALLSAAESEVERARQAVDRSSALSGEADCPLCGQSLGDAFETVQGHRVDELSQAQARMDEIATAVSGGTRSLAKAERKCAELSGALERARATRAEWEQAASRRHDAAAALDTAWTAAVTGGAGSGAAPTLPDLEAATASAKARRDAIRQAEGTLQRIRGRLESRPGIEKGLADDLAEIDTSQGRVEALREKVRALGFDKAQLDQAREGRDAAERSARLTGEQAREAAVLAAGAQARAAAASAKLAGAREQHDKLADLALDARHVGRTADLLSDFRNTVVASVGPRLAMEAAQLFGELTDSEYEKLEVDPDNYELQIVDGGHLYPLDRFSGSEIDLANLALRVAISEHIHFQSGGSVGLLVLDEVFGPLDEDRKSRMLLALERLKGRFRQVLVVTHDADIKEQLPSAVEVVKLPGRRATARVLGD
jgi:exonuclease SbcC